MQIHSYSSLEKSCHFTGVWQIPPSPVFREEWWYWAVLAVCFTPPARKLLPRPSLSCALNPGIPHPPQLLPQPWHGCGSTLLSPDPEPALPPAGISLGSLLLFPPLIFILHLFSSTELGQAQCCGGITECFQGMGKSQPPVAVSLRAGLSFPRNSVPLGRAVIPKGQWLTRGSRNTMGTLGQVLLFPGLFPGQGLHRALLSPAQELAGICSWDWLGFAVALASGRRGSLRMAR